MLSDLRRLSIDPEFQSLIPPLQPEERAQLEENLLREGCRDPLVVWTPTPVNGEHKCYRGETEIEGECDLQPGDGVWTCQTCGYNPLLMECFILDGHNRYEICQAHGIEFDTIEIELADRAAAEDWIDTNQLGRRNLTPDQASLLRGRRYNRTKKAEGAPRGNANASKQLAQNELVVSTAEVLADKHGVSPATIKRDGQYAAAVDTLKSRVPDIEQRIFRGEVPSREAVIAAAKTPEKAKSILDTSVHVSHNSGDNEWYTPDYILEAVREAMGTIHLDPASSPIANHSVQADMFYTMADDGLTQPWCGNVFMNPPYAAPLINQFTEAVSEHYDAKAITQACVLVNNATETAWFQRMLTSASAVCFLRRRVRFLDPAGDPSGQPLQGQAVIYLGENTSQFARSFADLGCVLQVVRP